MFLSSEQLICKRSANLSGQIRHSKHSAYKYRHKKQQRSTGRQKSDSEIRDQHTKSERNIMLFLRFCPIISIQAQDQCHSCRYAVQKPAWMHPHFPKCHTPKFVLKIFIFPRQAEINPDTHINCRCHGKDQKNNPEDFLFLLSPVNLPRYIFQLFVS